MAESALSDVKVLDFTHYVAGPYCTKLLADYGAEVLKIERPHSGDGARRLGPFPDDVPHPEKSGTFLHLNTNKRGMTLDLKTEAARNIVLDLVRDVDIVVESFRPGAMSRFGLDYHALKSVNPALVMTSISNFGQTGPYRDYKGSEIILYGMGGDMYSTGLEDREPIKLGGNVGLYQAGAIAAVATMGGLFASRFQDIGQHIDVSIMETHLGSIDRRMSNLLGHQYTGEIAPRGPLGASITSKAFPCQDGYLEATIGRGYINRVVGLLRGDGYFEDPKWDSADTYTQPELQAEAEDYFLEWALERTKLEAWQTTQEARVLSAPLNTMGDLSNDPNLNQRGAFAHIDHPVAGQLKYPGRPFILNESPWSVRHPAPLLGQHTDEVLERLDYSRAEIARLRQQGVI